MISIKDLQFSYKKKNIFNDLHLTILPGQICGLLGKNGTGKTTLLYCISGLLFPKRGIINILDHTPQKRQPTFLQEIFFVPEEFYLQGVTIDSFVKTNAAFYTKFSESQFNTYLAEFDIPVKNRLDEMSYGQKKKVLISFALACNTSVLLLDEPTNGLDILSKAQFKKVIAGITDNERTIIISTHQVKDLENLIDRIIIIEDTGIIFDESMETVGKKLAFKLSFDSEEKAAAIYTEESITGNAVVLPNHTNEENKIDLELLYKAVIMNRTVIKNLFQ